MSRDSNSIWPTFEQWVTAVAIIIVILAWLWFMGEVFGWDLR